MEPMTRSRPVPPAAVDALRRTVDGLVAYPTDAAYDALRTRRSPAGPDPDVVVVPSSEAGVCAVVTAVRTHGLQLAGRCVEGAPVVLVLTHRLADVVVDDRARTVTVGPGTSWRSLAAGVTGTGLCVPQVPGPRDGVRDDPDAPVLDAVWAGTTRVVSARVVRADGFVHVTDDARPPAGEPQAWIVTAVTLALAHPVVPAHEGTVGAVPAGLDQPFAPDWGAWKPACS